MEGDGDKGEKRERKWWNEGGGRVRRVRGKGRKDMRKEEG